MKILTFDGGGLRSVFSARLMANLENKHPGFMDKADFLAGTSGGAIVACGLAYGLSPQQIVELFEKNAKKIFKKANLIEDVEDLWNMVGARYDNSGLQDLLFSIFGATTLGQLRKPVLITSYALRHPSGRWQPAVFQTLGGKTSSSNLTIVDAILRSAAAPTFFPTYQDFGDGGLFANHAGMAAVAAALHPDVGGGDFSKLVVMCVGTGRNPQQLETSKNDLGAYDWLKNGIFDLLLDASMEAVDYYLKSLLSERYKRPQIDIPLFKIGLDDLDHIPTMIGFADGFDYMSLMNWVKAYWK